MATAALLAPLSLRADPGPPELPRLTGVIVAGPFRQAIFAAPGGTGSLVADEGDRIGPFTVHVIGPGEVELRASGGSYVLSPAPDGAIREALIILPPIMPLIDPYRREAETENDQ